MVAAPEGSEWGDPRPEGDRLLRGEEGRVRGDRKGHWRSRRWRDSGVQGDAIEAIWFTLTSGGGSTEESRSGSCVIPRCSSAAAAVSVAACACSLWGVCEGPASAGSSPARAVSPRVPHPCRHTPDARTDADADAASDAAVNAGQCRSTGRGSSSQSIPEEEDGPEESNENSDERQSKERSNKQSNKESHILHDISTDWRTFRANLVAREKVKLLDADIHHQQSRSSRLLGPKWAHPIPTPEAGCVLVATEKLDDTRSFERTVVLLLRVGTKDPKEGPFGVVINRPLRKTIKDMKPSNPKLATTFADCSLHFGGPLHTSMFLVTSGNKSLPGFEPVMPGLWFGARNNLDEAAEQVMNGALEPQDFRFFIGYSGWQLDQLMEEIELNYWYVAACGANLLTGPPDSLSGLWEEVLQLMGGRYSELSRKPRQDGT